LIGEVYRQSRASASGLDPEVLHPERRPEEITDRSNEKDDTQD